MGEAWDLLYTPILTGFIGTRVLESPFYSVGLDSTKSVQCVSFNVHEVTDVVLYTLAL